MICLFCNEEHFLPGERVVKQYFHGKTFKIRADVMICVNCGWHTVDTKQANELLKKTKEAYDKWQIEKWLRYGKPENAQEKRARKKRENAEKANVSA